MWRTRLDLSGIESACVGSGKPRCSIVVAHSGSMLMEVARIRASFVFYSYQWNIFSFKMTLRYQKDKKLSWFFQFLVKFFRKSWAFLRRLKNLQHDSSKNTWKNAEFCSVAIKFSKTSVEKSLFDMVDMF